MVNEQLLELLNQGHPGMLVCFVMSMVMKILLMAAIRMMINYDDDPIKRWESTKLGQESPDQQTHSPGKIALLASLPDTGVLQGLFFFFLSSDFHSRQGPKFLS